MSRSIRQAAGFNVGTVIVIVIIIIGLGFIGWHMYTNQKQSLNPLTQQSEQRTTPSSANYSWQIKELGIELTVPDTLKDITYTIRETDDSSKVVDISTDTLKHKDMQCSETQSAPPLGSLFIRQGVYPAEPTYESGILAKQFSTSYLAWRPPQGICSENEAVEQASESLREAFRQTFQSATEISQ